MTAPLLRGLLALALLVGLSSCPKDDDDPAPDAGSTEAGSSGTSSPRAGNGGAAADSGDGNGGAGRAGAGQSGSGGVPDVGVGGPGDSGRGGDAAPAGGRGDGPVGGTGDEPEAGASGSDVDAGREDPVDPPGNNVCGTRGAASCPDDQFCQFVSGSNCGADDRGGSCKPRPDLCTEQYDPVCGCDGVTYGNACKAAVEGISVNTRGECAGGGGRSDKLVDCDPAKILCRRAPPVCPEGQVPSVDAAGNCFGACVGIESCACTGPAQCPQNPDKYTCHMSGGHCTPYL